LVQTRCKECPAEASITLDGDPLCSECALARYAGRKQLEDEGAPKPTEQDGHAGIDLAEMALSILWRSR
jgi:hypothetical protein